MDPYKQPSPVPPAYTAYPGTISPMANAPPNGASTFQANAYTATHSPHAGQMPHQQQYAPHMNGGYYASPSPNGQPGPYGAHNNIYYAPPPPGVYPGIPGHQGYQQGYIPGQTVIIKEHKKDDGAAEDSLCACLLGACLCCCCLDILT